MRTDTGAQTVLRVELFGGLRVSGADDEVINLPSAKVRALLAFLAVHAGRPQRRERLADLLWSDAGTRARTNLRQILSRLRAALGEPASRGLIARRETVMLDPACVCVDVVTFKSLAGQQSATANRQAALCYRGELLDGLDGIDPEFDRWRESEAQTARELALQLKSELLDHARRDGRTEEAIRFAVELLAIDPLQEQVQHALIHLYLAQGRNRAAFEQVQRATELFRSELGVAPSWSSGTLLDRTETESAHATGRIPFVGREQERAVLRVLIETGLHSRAGVSVLIRGEAGIGKSRLVALASTWSAQAGFDLARIEMLEFGVGAGDDPVRALIRQVLARHGVSTRDSAGLAARLAAGDERRRVIAERLLRLPASPEQRRSLENPRPEQRATLECDVLSDLLRWSKGPWLFVIEDVHWLRARSAGRLASLIRAVRAAGSVLIMTTRSGGDSNGEAAELPPDITLTIELDGLSPMQCEQLARAYGEVRPQFVSRCIARASGNPLFLHHLLAGALEAPRPEIPSSVESVIRERMHGLRARDRTLLDAAAVAGPRLDRELLQALAGTDAIDLHTLSRRDFLTERGGVVRFSHDLVREVVYSQLDATRRQALHRRAAQWFELRDPLMRAQHLERAQDPEAPAAFVRAALALNREHRYTRALEAVNRGMTLDAAADAAFDLVDLQGVLLRNLGATRACLNAFEQALLSADNEIQRCRAWIGLAAGLRVTGQFDEAIAHLERAQQVAGPRSLAVALAMIHRLRGSLYFSEGRLGECWNEHQTAHRYALSVGSAEHEARTLGGLGDAHYGFGRMRSALRCFQACVERAGTLGLRRVAAAHLAMCAATRLYLNDPGGALRDAQRAIEDAEDIGYTRALMLAHGVLGDTFLEQADTHAARTAFARALSFARQLEALRFQSLYLVGLSRCARIDGDTAQAREQAETSLALCRKTGMRFAGPAALGALALASTAAKRTALMSEGRRLLVDGCVAHNHLRYLDDAIDADLESGRFESVRRHARALEALVRGERVDWAHFRAARGRALAAAGTGRRSTTLNKRIASLVDEGQRLGLARALPALESALRAQ